MTLKPFALTRAAMNRAAMTAVLAVAACASPSMADWGTSFETAAPFVFERGGKSGTGGAVSTNFTTATINDGGDLYMQITSPGVTAGQLNLAVSVVSNQNIRDVRVRSVINRNGGVNVNGLQGVVARYNPANGSCYALAVDFTAKTIQLQKWTAGSSVPTVLRTSVVNNLIEAGTPVIAELTVFGNVVSGYIWNTANTAIIQSETVTDNNSPLTTGLAGVGVMSRIVGGVGTSVPAGNFDNMSAISGIRDADLNKDGFDDIFWRNQNVGIQGVWLLNAQGLIGGWSGLPFVGDLNWRQVSTADFDQDNNIDVLWFNAATREVAVWALNSDGSLKLFQVVGVLPAGWRPQACADFNRDGNADIFMRNTSTGENGMWLMERLTLRSFTGVSYVGDLGWNVEASGDFNRDGSPDLLWRNSTSGEVAFWLMNGTRLLDFQLFTQLGTEWQIIGSGDFNNDSLLDILWRNNSSNLVVQWFMVGTIYSSWQPVEFIPAVEWRGIN
jgi:hypothetical protein